MPGRAETLSLARQLLRAARTFPDYNQRECVLRRSPPAAVGCCLAAVRQLALWGRRQLGAAPCGAASSAAHLPPLPAQLHRAPRVAGVQRARHAAGARRRSSAGEAWAYHSPGAVAQGEAERLAALAEGRKDLELVRRQVRGCGEAARSVRP